MIEPKLLYFAYGSNLNHQQMDTRCPNNKLIGIAELQDHKWLINERGYANIVYSLGLSVWGTVYQLNKNDEERLDGFEGVPHCYEKCTLPVRLIEAGTAEEKMVDALVYVDRHRVSPSAPKEEYVVRMNRGIVDAITDGIPEVWIKSNIRSFIPSS